MHHSALMSLNIICKKYQRGVSTPSVSHMSWNCATSISEVWQKLVCALFKIILHSTHQCFCNVFIKLVVEWVVLCLPSGGSFKHNNGDKWELTIPVKFYCFFCFYSQHPFWTVMIIIIIIIIIIIKILIYIYKQSWFFSHHVLQYECTIALIKAQVLWQFYGLIHLSNVP